MKWQFYFYTHTLTLILQTTFYLSYTSLNDLHVCIQIMYKGVPFIMAKIIYSSERHCSEPRVVQNHWSLVMIYTKFLHQPKSLDISEWVFLAYSKFISILTAVFFLKLVQCQSQLNHEIQPFGVEGVRFTHINPFLRVSKFQPF